MGEMEFCVMVASPFLGGLQLRICCRRKVAPDVQKLGFEANKALRDSQDVRQNLLCTTTTFV